MSAGSYFKWQIPPEVLAGQVKDYGKRLLLAIYKLGQVFAARIETYAKQNAPWTDRSSNARQGLHAKAFQIATGVIIRLAHGVSYGIHLELGHAGKYAIIIKALEAHYGPLMVALKALVAK